MANSVLVPIVRLDKKAIQEVVARQHEAMGLTPEPMATAQLARKLMLELGIRPEDNLGSCGIISAREE